VISTLRLRFYGPLNDFLPVRFRYRRFIHQGGAPGSVKDAIESLGIPHPEVDLILVNGTPESFDHQLCDGDDVAVYPPFRSIDLGATPRVGSELPSPIRFVVDAHLGVLASRLRLCGFDTTLLEDDGEVAMASVAEHRIALTRDVGVLKRRIVRHGYWVRETDPERQVPEVMNRFDLVERMQPFTRCLRCNTPIEDIEASTIAERLPERTRASHQRFWHCPGCDRVYWQGSHYAHLLELIDSIRTRFSGRNSA
jgi:uncharacterized protein with PIN domain